MVDTIWVIIVAGAVIALLIAAAKNKAAAAAKAAYESGLERLKRDPGNADLRQEILKLGRAYSNATRNNKGVTLFDEVALLNDVNAACGSLGGHPAAPPAAKPSAASSPSIEDRLKNLQSLKRRGLISEAEYESKRSKLLDEV